MKVSRSLEALMPRHRSSVRILLWSAALLFLNLSVTGCPHHDVRFEQIGHTIENKQYDASAVVVIPASTTQEVVPIRSFMAGYANTWDVRPGHMLRQVVDVEFPQMFKSYRVSEEYTEPEGTHRRLVLDLAVTKYAFDDFRATVIVRAIAYAPGRVPLFEKTYQEEGDTQGGKMFGGGAFAMKSAIRQSSYDAYKKAFAKLRADLAAVLDKP